MIKMMRNTLATVPTTLTKPSWNKDGLFLVVLLICIFRLSNAVAGPIADYGDAPDGVGLNNYPSLHNSPNAAVGLNSPFHIDTTKEWLGNSAPSSITTLEADSLQVDGDIDDSNTVMFMLDSAGIGKRGYIFTTLSYDPSLGEADEARYLNVVSDFNKDGHFGDITPMQREWVIRNMPVIFSDLPVGVTHLNLFVGFHLDETLAGMSDIWTRITLSTEQAPTLTDLDWDGSGPLNGFARGETEDLLLNIQEAAIDINGNPIPPAPGKPPVIGFGPKKIHPLPVVIEHLRQVVVGGALHDLAPAGGAPLVHVANLKINVQKAGQPIRITWFRDCDIAAGACVHAGPGGPNAANMRLVGPGGAVIAPPGPVAAGAILQGPPAAPPAFIGPLVLNKGINRLPIFAGFPNPGPGDTHTHFTIITDPEDEYYFTMQQDDYGSYDSLSPADKVIDHVIAAPPPCDADGDADIDKLDLSLISRARGQAAQPDDQRDANGDGQIDLSDTKICIPLCTRANCAIQ